MLKSEDGGAFKIWLDWVNSFPRPDYLTIGPNARRIMLAVQEVNDTEQNDLADR